MPRFPHRIFASVDRTHPARCKIAKGSCGQKAQTTESTNKYEEATGPNHYEKRICSVSRHQRSEPHPAQRAPSDPPGARHSHAPGAPCRTLSPPLAVARCGGNRTRQSLTCRHAAGSGRTSRGQLRFSASGVRRQVGKSSPRASSGSRVVCSLSRGDAHRAQPLTPAVFWVRHLTPTPRLPRVTT